MPRRSVREVPELARHLPSVQSVCSQDSELDVPVAAVDQRHEEDVPRGDRQAALRREALVGRHLSQEASPWSPYVLPAQPTAPAKTGMNESAISGS